MKKHLIRTFALIFALSALCFCFASCGASKNNSVGDYIDKSEMESPSESNGLADVNSTVTAPTDTTERKVIKTFDISSETKDYDAAITALNALITEQGGYVESASSSNKSLNNTSDSYTRYANYIIRVPAENAEAFVGSVGNLFNVTSNNSYIEDVSETYYSIEARLEELQAERDSLLDIMDQSDTKKDYDLWLTVHQRLSEVIQQIAVYQGQLNRYDSKIAYSTVNLSIREVLTYTAVGGDNSFGSRLGASFKEGWNDFVIGLQDFIIWFAGALPVLLLLAVIGAAIVLIVTSARRKSKNKKAPQPPEQPPKQGE